MKFLLIYHLLTPLLPLYINLDNCRSTLLIKNKKDGRYNLMVKNKEVSSIILPNIALTNVTNIQRFLYDLNAPEPNLAAQENQPPDVFDEMEQGDLEPDQQQPST